jgi:hypothetical protein
VKDAARARRRRIGDARFLPPPHLGPGAPPTCPSTVTSFRLHTTLLLHRGDQDLGRKTSGQRPRPPQDVRRRRDVAALVPRRPRRRRPLDVLAVHLLVSTINDLP